MRVRLSFIMGILVAGIAALSCARRSEAQNGDTPQGAPFQLNITTTHGERTQDAIISRAGMRFTLESSKDDEYNYIMEYSINNGESKLIESIWSGATWNIDYEFTGVPAGEYRVKGFIYREEEPETRLAIDESLWMRYKIETLSVPSMTTEHGSFSFDDESHVVYVGDSGSLIMTFTPINSSLPLKATSSNDKVIRFDNSAASCSRGSSSVPFSVIGTGSAAVTVSVDNGPDSPEWKIFVTSVYPDDNPQAGGVKVTLTHDFLTTNHSNERSWFLYFNVHVVKSLHATPFNLSFSVDGAEPDVIKEWVFDETGTSDNEDVIKNIRPLQMPSQGTHTLHVDVVKSGTDEVYFRSDMTFYCYNPVLLMDNKEVFYNRDNRYATTGLLHKITLAGIPGSIPKSFILSRLSLTSDKADDTIIATDNGWDFKRNTPGNGYMTLSVIEPNGDEMPYRFYLSESPEK